MSEYPDAEGERAPWENERAALLAEVERLREEVEYQKEMRKQQLHLRDKADAEVERLREENDRLKGGLPVVYSVPDLDRLHRIEEAARAMLDRIDSKEPPSLLTVEANRVAVLALRCALESEHHSNLRGWEMDCSAAEDG